MVSLTRPRLMPPIKIYETEQTTQSYLLKEKEMVKLPQNDLDYMEKAVEVESKKDASIMN